MRKRVPLGCDGTEWHGTGRDGMRANFACDTTREIRKERKGNYETKRNASCRCAAATATRLTERKGAELDRVAVGCGSIDRQGYFLLRCLEWVAFGNECGMRRAGSTDRSSSIDSSDDRIIEHTSALPIREIGKINRTSAS